MSTDKRNEARLLYTKHGWTPFLILYFFELVTFLISDIVTVSLMSRIKCIREVDHLGDRSCLRNDIHLHKL